MVEKIEKNDYISVVPIGGMEEIGKNMTAVGFRNEYILIDVGIKFPDESDYGVEGILPDFRFVHQNRRNIKGVFITHGHQDHIGGLPYFIEKFPEIPIYGSKLTIELIKNKLSYYQSIKNPKLFHIDVKKTKVKYQNLCISFFPTVHSIFDAIGIVVETPLGNVVHTGDFKVDLTQKQQQFDLERMKEIKNQGVKMLIIDSTNAEKEGVSPSEESVKLHLLKEMEMATGKTIISTFASSLARIQNIFDITETLNKKLVIIGKSMERNVDLCLRLGYLRVQEDTLIAEEDLDDFPREKIVVLTTGAQGEPTAGLSKLSNGKHKKMRLIEGDTVIFSSSVVPGNEKSVNSLVNRLLKNNVNVVQKKELHTSGHGQKDEIKSMIDWLKPEYYLPSHGEYKMLFHNKKIAIESGINKDKIFLSRNGYELIVGKNHSEMRVLYDDEPQYMDISKNGFVNFYVSKERERMATQGLLIIDISKGKKKWNIHYETRGIASKFDRKKLKTEIANTFFDMKKKLKNEMTERDLIRQLSQDLKPILRTEPLFVVNFPK